MALGEKKRMNKITDSDQFMASIRKMVSLEEELSSEKAAIETFVVENRMYQFFSINWKALRRECLPPRR